MEPNGPVRVRLIPFVHSQSYRPIKVHLAPNYHLAGSPLELCQVPLGVPGPQFGNHCFRGYLGGGPQLNTRELVTKCTF